MKTIDRLSSDELKHGIEMKTEEKSNNVDYEIADKAEKLTAILCASILILISIGFALGAAFMHLVVNGN